MGEVEIPMDQFFAATSPWRKQITDWTPYDDPFYHAAPAGGAWTPIPADKTVSRAWVEGLCAQMGFDANTGAFLPGASKSNAWMGASNPLYIVPADQPLRRMFLDPNSYGTTGAGDLDRILQTGVPIPDDAVTENQWGVDVQIGGTVPTAGSLKLRVYDGATLLGTTATINYDATAAFLDGELERIIGGAGVLTGTGVPVTVTTKGVKLNSSGAGFQVVFSNPSKIRLESVDNTTINATSTKDTPAIRVHGRGDRWVNVYQPSTDSLWELFRVTASIPGGPLDMVGWGGVILNRGSWTNKVSEHSGTYQKRTELDGTVTGGSRWGGNATSTANVPFIDAKILAKVQAQGRDAVYPAAFPLSLGHAQASPRQYVWPATRGDGIDYNKPGQIPEGARIAFPPTSAVMSWIDAKVRAEFRPLALAAVYHGIIPRDKTGSGCNLQIRNYGEIGSTGANGTNWRDLLPLYQTTSDAAWQYVSSLPWHLAVIVHPDQSR